jgi:hypothetical protein
MSGWQSGNNRVQHQKSSVLACRLESAGWASDPQHFVASGLCGAVTRGRESQNCGLIAATYAAKLHGRQTSVIIPNKDALADLEVELDFGPDRFESLAHERQAWHLLGRR